MGKSHLFQVSTDSFFVCCDEGGVEEMGILAMIFLGDACFKQLHEFFEFTVKGDIFCLGDDKKTHWFDHPQIINLRVFYSKLRDIF